MKLISVHAHRVHPNNITSIMSEKNIRSDGTASQGAITSQDTHRSDSTHGPLHVEKTDGPTKEVANAALSNATAAQKPSLWTKSMFSVCHPAS